MVDTVEQRTGISFGSRCNGDVGVSIGPADALRSDLVERARALIPQLQKNAPQAEVDRRIADENVRVITQSELFRIMVPRRFGGLETDFCTFLEVTRELARGCGSTGWAFSLINACAWITALGSDRLQWDVWGENLDARVAGAFAGLGQSCRRVDDGLVVSGQWPWSSGCLHANWGLVGVPIVDNSGQVVDQGFALIPMSDLTIQESWFMAGMKGTGSNTLIARDVLVPDYRILSTSSLVAGKYHTPHKDETLYRSAFVPVAALILAGPQLGLATAALEFVMAAAGKRGIAYTCYESQTAAPTVQLALARAVILVETAHLHAYRAAADLDGAARSGRTLEYIERARIRMETGYVAETAREAIRILCSAHGASSFAESNPLQRIWRDAEVASRHAIVNPEINAEIFGRALLGDTKNITNLV
jgi:3-hydroxy-9,10-secoandrosta-1,3,5(10)-triene-9,17-dione monooxygenase